MSTVCVYVQCRSKVIYDRVPRARTRVHARVSVNNSVILSTRSSNVSSIVFLQSEGMPRRLSDYARERVV